MPGGCADCVTVTVAVARSGELTLSFAVQFAPGAPGAAVMVIVAGVLPDMGFALTKLPQVESENEIVNGDVPAVLRTRMVCPTP